MVERQARFQGCRLDKARTRYPSKISREESRPPNGVGSNVALPNCDLAGVSPERTSGPRGNQRLATLLHEERIHAIDLPLATTGGLEVPSSCTRSGLPADCRLSAQYTNTGQAPALDGN
jgi:hypothetical protein